MWNLVAFLKNFFSLSCSISSGTALLSHHYLSTDNNILFQNSFKSRSIAVNSINLGMEMVDILGFVISDYGHRAETLSFIWRAC